MLKKYTIVYILALASCTQERTPKSTNIETDITTASPEEININDNKKYCFISVEKQDTTTVAFTITNDQVVGEMNWTPFEKDSKKGSIKGTMRGKTIDATWTYMQEGVQDTVSVAFNLAGDTLEQKPFTYNTQNQRLQTDQSAGFTVTYKKEACTNVKH